ncbi:protein TIME FOR COFFEE-like isoform X2 [Magnolia sinica]|uniref:protein TIME FOR COFFEE-like isoform X2 n=1 Tax=Magnolia sinica TaxID=86752 RepID=UPI00265A037C|nr:protein TIME FOR COFFEE-like isoform X2 [Magnolia sinica]
MERNRESRRGTAAVSGSFSSSRRRSRGNVFRESHGVSEVEDGGNDPVVRDRSNGNDRSRRRRRLSSSNESFRVDQDDVADGSSDESLDEEHEEEDEMVPRTGGSLRQASRGKSQWKGSDEVIGVSVPRKARSASAKRLQDSFPAVRQSSSSSPARTSAASVSPPPSNASMRAGKRMKPVTMKTKPMKTSKVSISESEVEVEVAQVLYGLTRLQSHPSPAKPEIFQTSSPKLDLKHNSSNEASVSVVSKASSPVSSPVSPPSSQPLVLPQHSSPVAAPTLMAPKRKKPKPVSLEDSSDPTTLMACSSKSSGSTNAGNPISLVAASPVMKMAADKDPQGTKVEVLSAEGDKHAAVSNSDSSKPETSLPVSSTCQTSMPRDPLHPEEKPSSLNPAEAKTVVSPEERVPVSVVPTTAEERILDADCKLSIDQNQQITQKEMSSFSQDLPVPDVKLEAPKMCVSPHKICSSVSAATEGVKGPRIEIDLMAPPENFCPDDCMTNAVDRSAPLASDYGHRQVIDGTVDKSKGITNIAEKMEVEKASVKQDHSILSEVKIQVKEAVEEVNLEKQSVNERKTESHHDGHNLDRAGNKQQHFQKLTKSTARQAERTAPPIGIIPTAATPTPMMIPGWHGGLPPFGYLGSSPANPSGVPSVRGAIHMEGNAAIPNAPVVMLPHPRPNRCATHLFIARLIHYQQQLARLNPFWHAAAAAGSAALYGAKPYNMSILPQSDVLLFGGSSIRNPNTLPNSSLGCGSAGSLNGHNLKEKAPNSFADVPRKQPLLPQSAQQGPAFIFPISQSKAGETKPGGLAESAGLLSASGAAAAAVAAAAASANTKFGNIATPTSDPQYLTMLHSNYPFPVPPPYRAHINQQPLQPAAAPFFAGSFYPSQLLQLQSHSLPQTQNPTCSTGSLTSHKQHLRPPHGFPASKPPESHGTELEPPKNSEDGTDGQASLVQKKKLQAQNFPSNYPNLNTNLPQNFPIMAAALGGKLPQQPGDPGFQTIMKGVEVARPVPPGQAMLQALPDVGHNHYQLGNLSKAPAKVPVARDNDKSTESSHPPSMGTAVQQQVMARAKPAVSAASTVMASGGMAYADRMPVVYSSANFPGGPMGLSNMQNPLQWKMQSSQRVAQAGPLGNAILQSPAAVLATSNAGSPAGKVAKLPSTPLNSSQKVMTTGPSVSAQSAQAQSLGKNQQLFFNSEPVHQSGGTALPQKRHAEPNSVAQAVFSGNMNARRAANQHAQPVLTGSGAGSYVVGGGKGAAVLGPLVGGPIAAMAGASYGKSATNLPAKSTEQKPATA